MILCDNQKVGPLFEERTTKGDYLVEEVTKTTLPVGSIIPKLDMDPQVPGAINPC